MTVKAKFRCHFIQKADDDSSRTIHMSAVTCGSHENDAWLKFTPGGQILMHISNHDAFNQFEQGKDYYIEIKSAHEEIIGGLSIWTLPKDCGIPI